VCWSFREQPSSSSAESLLPKKGAALRTTVITIMTPTTEQQSLWRLVKRENWRSCTYRFKKHLPTIFLQAILCYIKANNTKLSTASVSLTDVGAQQRQHRRYYDSDDDEVGTTASSRQAQPICTAVAGIWICLFL